MQRAEDVVVVGAGIIGAAIAWRCAQHGLRVAVVDPEPGRGAWHTAAGMLAPVTELHYEETPLLRLNLESAGRYGAFAAELTDLTTLPTGYTRSGTLAVAWDAADLAALRDLHDFGRTLGLDATMVTGRELRRLEPALAVGLPGGMLAADDHQVDPRLLHAALLAAGERCGVRLVASTARVRQVADRVVGVELDDGERIDAATTVLAAGAWSAHVQGVPDGARPPVRPVKGQTLRLRTESPVLDRVVRGSVKGHPIYVVPRASGEVVVGASTEEAGFDVRPRAGAVYELLRDAQALVPELGEAVLVDVSTGLRPGSRDNAPLIGRAPVEGLVVATGHYRNGVLLTPVTADAVAALVTTGVAPDMVAPFSPLRDVEAVPS